MSKSFIITKTIIIEGVEYKTKVKKSNMNPEKHFIEGVELTEKHIGSKVTYIPRHAKGNASHPDCEGGRIKSWNDGGVFVDYTKNVCRTDFNDLVWG